MVDLRFIKRLTGGIITMLAVALLSGCQSPEQSGQFQPVVIEPTNPVATETSVAGNQSPTTTPVGSVFNEGDLVVVTFSGLSEPIPPHEEKVKEDGTITLPFIGPVDARGKGPGELQKTIRDKYVNGKIFPSNLTVTVKGQERFFFVDGEVRLPNRYIWSDGMTVLKAISSAGGFSDFAKKSKVSVTRQDGRTLKVNCEKALENPELDVPVYPGDRVVVPRRWL